ncbi:MAG: hypothetical protein K1X79_03725 [Oligoflexia bacterium]|nr:hypothetical protein [Oligoflexia bacterium]
MPETTNASRGTPAHNASRGTPSQTEFATFCHLLSDPNSNPALTAVKLLPESEHFPARSQVLMACRRLLCACLLEQEAAGQGAEAYDSDMLAVHGTYKAEEPETHDDPFGVPRLRDVFAESLRNGHPLLELPEAVRAEMLTMIVVMSAHECRAALIEMPGFVDLARSIGQEQWAIQAKVLLEQISAEVHPVVFADQVVQIFDCAGVALSCGELVSIIGTIFDWPEDRSDVSELATGVLSRSVEQFGDPASFLKALDEGVRPLVLESLRTWSTQARLDAISCATRLAPFTRKDLFVPALAFASLLPDLVVPVGEGRLSGLRAKPAIATIRELPNCEPASRIALTQDIAELSRRMFELNPKLHLDAESLVDAMLAARLAPDDYREAFDTLLGSPSLDIAEFIQRFTMCYAQLDGITEVDRRAMYEVIEWKLRAVTKEVADLNVASIAKRVAQNLGIALEDGE